ncbi:hypothetical protein AB0I10_12540 [Streptomyces sp. NPDC050636]|uniref:hypothetical protein n=1 Tax=Streptomyces sp. NPDC050636 TaxID=3154510 RepID=UPI00341B8EEB
MTILRRHLSTGFTVMPTASVEDSRLSFRARGILAYLIAKPDSWTVRTESIAKAGKEGRDAVREAVKELKTFGYYRVVNERHADGTLTRVTEVYDSPQGWVAEEYRDQEAQRLARKLGRKLEQNTDSGTDDGFSDIGSPVVGSPVAGGSGVIGSNHSQYPEKKNPPTPTADAAGESDAAGDEFSQAGTESGGECSAHPDVPGRSCRACGTSPRAQREVQERAEKAKRNAAERSANHRVLAEVRRRPGGDGLSDVARQRVAEMRRARRDAAPEDRVRSTRREK